MCRRLLLFCALVFLLLPGRGAVAQALATLRGVVVTVDGRPVKGATVKAGASPPVVTDAGGLFSMKVKAGTYDVAITSPGYKGETMAGVALKPGETKDVCGVLQK
jgi:uncharacterized membrane protein